MTSGTPLTFEQKEYIIKNKDRKFMSQMAGELGISRRAVKENIKRDGK